MHFEHRFDPQSLKASGQSFFIFLSHTDSSSVLESISKKITQRWARIKKCRGSIRRCFSHFFIPIIFKFNTAVLHHVSHCSCSLWMVSFNRSILELASDNSSCKLKLIRLGLVVKNFANHIIHSLAFFKVANSPSSVVCFFCSF